MTVPTLPLRTMSPVLRQQRCCCMQRCQPWHPWLPSQLQAMLSIRSRLSLMHEEQTTNAHLALGDDSTSRGIAEKCLCEWSAQHRQQGCTLAVFMLRVLQICLCALSAECWVQARGVVQDASYLTP